MNGRIWLGGALALTVCATLSASPGSTKPAEDLVVHEWGTFLSMQGSDGVTLDGMYHEEHALPQFVHSRSKDQLRMRSVDVKGETPVIYFYTAKPRTVTVTVGFPQGIWTQWFPQGIQVAPGLAQTSSPPEPRNGRLVWRPQLFPSTPKGTLPKLPATPHGSLWDHAREVDAAYVQTQSNDGPEIERFLFYRGLGKATLPLSYKASDPAAVSWQGAPSQPARDLFLLQVKNGKGSWAFLPELRSGTASRSAFGALSAPLPLPEFSKRVADALAARLESHGLFKKEARAMVNTWRESYFHTEGERILYVLPQEWTDRFIPLTIEPKPRQTVRVMVGRLEILTPEREQKIETATRNLASPDSAVRGQAFQSLRGLGRYAEPALKRVLTKTTNETVRLLARRLLTTGFVTELRANVSTTDPKEKTVENPVFVRAQLASLLHEIGMADEAKAEATRALAELRNLPAPNLDEAKARHPLRAQARMMEGMGDTAGAATAYREFIRFGAQALQKTQCISCHRAFNTEGPKDRTWFRDWWAGKRFAQHAMQAGIAEQVLAAAENPTTGSPGVDQLLAAYLYEARGETQRAKQLWAAVEAGDGAARTANREE